MENKDIRWLQRFRNFRKAFAQLEKAVAQEAYSDLERQGLVKAFEFTYELAWNTLKDFLLDQGYDNLIGSKDTIRVAYQTGLITQGDVWMTMLNSRNLTAHTYNRETAEEIEKAVKQTYYGLFKELEKRMEHEVKGRQQDLFDNEANG